MLRSNINSDTAAVPATIISLILIINFHGCGILTHSETRVIPLVERNVHVSGFM